MTARVTIVTRTRDREVLLARSLASVREQSLTDYELVVVNDAGDPQVVERLVAEQPEVFRARIKVVHNQRSAGREAALESGLAVSHGEFFAIHDDDDTWAPAFLERCVATLDAHPEYGAVATRCVVVHEHLEDGVLVEDSREVLAATTHSWSLLDTLVANYVPPISQLVRRDLADEIGHWDGTLQTQADWDFNIRLLTRTAAGFLAEEPLAFWHQRPPQGGTLGNSVVDDARQHLVDNTTIRDRYARQEAAEGGVGHLLVSAAYFQRLHDELQHLAGDLGRLEQRVNSVDAAVHAQNPVLEAHTRSIATIEHGTLGLSESVRSLHDYLGKLLESLLAVHQGLGQNLQRTQEIHDQLRSTPGALIGGQVRKVARKVDTVTGLRARLHRRLR
ncbi:glycosyltransferase family 2 protein [Actinomyces weissii]|uniref:Glycosyltransferase family 2 protein n=1 Tax=Actinomyces weissii TaxID=675090 RepID=A0A7T7M923_9ACTO|nr:glycosyltransferase family A protein [Actinomyces weissii]QQM67000.1 glycosyltransferase family 2 protein [Actinomyces weissii]